MEGLCWWYKLRCEWMRGDRERFFFKTLKEFTSKKRQVRCFEVSVEVDPKRIVLKPSSGGVACLTIIPIQPMTLVHCVSKSACMFVERVPVLYFFFCQATPIDGKRALGKSER